MPCVIEEMPKHFQLAEKQRDKQLEAREVPADEYKAMCERKLARQDALPKDIRELCYEYGLINVWRLYADYRDKRTGKLIRGIKDAKKLRIELQHRINLRRIEDDKIIGLHKGLETGTIVDIF